ncbi:Auxin responsive protein [Musa troglodytarum]|uniref:Auxin responsive protein n=1 Tax=Musa troglodytarum TaxID=320322 RepID=A0A9E7FS70_9LILI|nr:Auxin responsive protein [Musa troglodytarum]
MKRYKGFKSGRRFVRVWRWVVRRRPGRYLRLDTATECSTSKPNLPNTCKTEASRLFRWGHHFARRLRRGPHASPGEFGAEAPLLDGEGGRGWRTRPPPKGHLPVYVGGRRYVVPVVYFNHPLLRELLREAEVEFGFHHPGGITIPCAAAEFERVRTRISDAGKRLHRRSPVSLWS